MAPIPSAASGLHPVEAYDPIAERAKALGVQNLIQRQQLGQQELQSHQMAMEEQKRSTEEQEDLARHWREARGDMDKTMSLAVQGGRIRPKTLMGLQQQILSAQQERAKLDETILNKSVKDAEFTARTADALLKVPEPQRQSLYNGFRAQAIQFRFGDNTLPVGVPSQQELELLSSQGRSVFQMDTTALRTRQADTAAQQAGTAAITAGVRQSAEERAKKIQQIDDVAAHLRTAKDADEYAQKRAEAKQTHPDVVDRFPNQWSDTIQDEINFSTMKGKERSAELTRRTGLTIPRTIPQLARDAEDMSKPKEERDWAKRALQAAQRTSPTEVRLERAAAHAESIQSTASRFLNSAGGDVAKAKKLMDEAAPNETFIQQNRLALTRAFQSVKTDWLDSFGGVSDAGTGAGSGGKPTPPKASVKPPATVSPENEIEVVKADGSLATIKAKDLKPDMMKVRDAPKNAKTTTKAQVEAFAKGKNIKYEDAKKQVESEGYLVK